MGVQKAFSENNFNNFWYRVANNEYETAKKFYKTPAKVECSM